MEAACMKRDRIRDISVISMVSFELTPAGTSKGFEDVDTR